MKKTSNGTVVTPIEKHSAGDPSHVITLGAQTFEKKIGRSQTQKMIRLSIADQGRQAIQVATELLGQPEPDTEEGGS